MGHLEIERRIWWRKGEGTAPPADEWLNANAARVSVGARERCCRIGRHPQGFKRSAEDLQRLAGWSVSPERLRQIVEGDTVQEVLGYLQYEPRKLYEAVRWDCERSVRAGRMSVADSRKLLESYERGLEGYTYLE